MEQEIKERLKAETDSASSGGVLRKIVLAKSNDSSIVKECFSPFEKNGRKMYKQEIFCKDGKNLQKVISDDKLAETVIIEGENFRQITLLGENGASVELLISSKGKGHFSGSLSNALPSFVPVSQDNIKRYIIVPGQDGGFLQKLGITTANGQIHDKKQAKYRQINKFLEQVEAVADYLPKEGTLNICDLCCGKSYLTFAVYWYFTFLLHRRVELYGVDLKADVISYCTETAKSLGWGGIHFICGDVSRFEAPTRPDLVLSLHACDVATDYVLAGAVRNRARVILSTPCCHHELNKQINCPTLSFLTDYSMLRQKLASAATDGLRARLLEIHGYKVTVCELIDPEETPKNLLIRAIDKGISKGTERFQAERDYQNACEFLGVTPTLYKLIGFPEK